MSARGGRGRGQGNRGNAGGQQSLPFRSSNDQRGGRGGFRGGRGGAQTPPPSLYNPGYPAVEETAITQREDTLIKLNNKDTSTTLPYRPAYGQKGDKLLVWTNYVRLEMPPDMVLHRYAVKVKRGNTEAAKGIAKRIIQLLIIDHLRPKIDAVSDLRSTLITRQPLNESQQSLLVTYRAEGEDMPDDDARQYTVTSEPSGTLDVSQLIDYTTSSRIGSTLSRNQELIQALNIVTGYASRTDPSTVTVGRNLRVSTAANQPRLSLGGGLEALRAFVFSARAATERVLINVQIKNLPFLTPTPLDQLVNAFLGAGGKPATLNPFLRMIQVEVTHIQRRGRSGKIIPRYKTILGLARRRDGRDLAHPPRVTKDGAGSKEVEFWLEDSPASAGHAKGKGTKPTSGRYITVFDFFRSHHNITIRDAASPVVNVGSLAQPSYLPLQVCNVRSGQVARGIITPRQTAEMIKFAVREPHANAESIRSIGLNLLHLERGELSAFGLQASPRLLVVPARRLQAPQVNYAGKTNTVANAKWDLRNTKLLQGATLSSWRCVIIAATGARPVWEDPPALQRCLGAFANGLKELGIRVLTDAPAPELVRVDSANPSTAISTKFREIASSPKGRPSIVLVVIPSNNNTAIYNAVKYACDVQDGLLCQCVVDTKLAKEQTQYFQNVGLKMNLKLGGANHSIPASTFGTIAPDKTMFVGLDVTHPSPGSTSSAPSVAGIVSSIDSTLAQWPAAIRVQEGKKEMVTDLVELIQGQLKLWRAKNKTLPANIILYRDGVSEGQYQVVLDEELPAIKKATNGLYSPVESRQGLPRLCIIVVGKRHHTRFYPTIEADQDRTGNLRNGLVVDRGVTQYANWDFFLQAHSALHGTAKPAHYYVIYDELLRKLNPTQAQSSAADALEKMTHGLCYLFGRSTTAVSICPPAKYADLVCERARCYLSEQFAPTDTDTLSQSSGSTTATTAAQRATLHDAIKNKMFYI